MNKPKEQIECPQCGNLISKTDDLRCPRCNYLLIPLGCSNCQKCSNKSCVKVK